MSKTVFSYKTWAKFFLHGGLEYDHTHRSASSSLPPNRAPPTPRGQWVWEYPRPGLQASLYVLYKFYKFYIGFYMFYIGFHKFYIGFYKFYIGIYRLPDSVAPLSFVPTSCDLLATLLLQDERVLHSFDRQVSPQSYSAPQIVLSDAL